MTKALRLAFSSRLRYTRNPLIQQRGCHARHDSGSGRRLGSLSAPRSHHGDELRERHRLRSPLERLRIRVVVGGQGRVHGDGARGAGRGQRCGRKRGRRPGRAERAASLLEGPRFRQRRRRSACPAVVRVLRGLSLLGQLAVVNLRRLQGRGGAQRSVRAARREAPIRALQSACAEGFVAASRGPCAPARGARARGRACWKKAASCASGAAASASVALRLRRSGTLPTAALATSPPPPSAAAVAACSGAAASAARSAAAEGRAGQRAAGSAGDASAGPSAAEVSGIAARTPRPAAAATTRTPRPRRAGGGGGVVARCGAARRADAAPRRERDCTAPGASVGGVSSGSCRHGAGSARARPLCMLTAERSVCVCVQVRPACDSPPLRRPSDSVAGSAGRCAVQQQHGAAAAQRQRAP